MAHDINRILDFLEDRVFYLKGLKQSTYEEKMTIFGDRYGAELDDMVRGLSEASDKGAEAKKIADGFAHRVRDSYAKKGRIPSNLQMDLNMMMIYYVFPYLLERGTDEAALMAQELKDSWNKTLGCNISYASYKDIYEGFRKRLFGFF